MIFTLLLVAIAMAQNTPNKESVEPITAAEAAPAAKETLKGSEAVYLAHPYGAYPYAAYPYAAYPYGAYPYAAVPYGYPAPYPFFRR
ncbi:hypothetical protein LSTR_LSTR017426 [Laodelphax striatellus]|nr:hypothetical protein LSTR_LSTR017426 [Laodelphax striatellus]